jgi:transcriptional regulator with XRE-family HTH domain
MNAADPFAIGEKLRKLREFHNFTQEYVAEQLHVRANTLSDYERGKVRVSREKLELAAALFQVDVNIFFSQEPLTFNIHNGSGATNGYNIIQDQHIVSQGLSERLLVQLEERTRRTEELFSRTLDLFEKVLGKLG